MQQGVLLGQVIPQHTFGVRPGDTGGFSWYLAGGRPHSPCPACPWHTGWCCEGTDFGAGLRRSPPLGVDQEVQQRVHCVELIVGHIAHGLLAHGALVGIARGLVVVREGDQASHHSQHCEGLDLQMGGLRSCRRQLNTQSDINRKESGATMAHCRLLRGDWLWWGKRVRPATTPCTVKGSICK